jgi:hypothetical protein
VNWIDLAPPLVAVFDLQLSSLGLHLYLHLSMCKSYGCDSDGEYCLLILFKKKAFPENVLGRKKAPKRYECVPCRVNHHQ